MRTAVATGYHTSEDGDAGDEGGETPRLGTQFGDTSREREREFLESLR